MRALASFGLVAASVGLLTLVTACGDDDSSFPPGYNPNPTNDGGDPVLKLGEGGLGGEGGRVPCTTGLCLKQVVCPNGGKTTVSGTVYDPAGKVPLYNVVVYVPNAPVDPIQHGASCDKCGATLSGSPIVSTATDYKGNFSLENVPVDANVPLVIQVGKWRRQITIPSVASCTDTPIIDKDMTRLPRNQAEGDLPQMALTTGGADPLECLPRKMGISDSEFTSGTGTGRVHLYKGSGSNGPAGQAAGGSTSAQAFWSDINNIKKYDMVLLGCEGDTFGSTKPKAALQAMYDYAGMGGRVFGSHYHYYWLESGVQEWPTTATWSHAAKPADGAAWEAAIDTSYEKGQAFSDWMTYTHSTDGPSQFSVVDPRQDATSVNSATSLRWASAPAHNNTVLYYSFNTPVSATPDMQCGKVVYSDIHVASGDTTGKTFPNGCTTTDLSPQEKALEFMLFDLSSCIQKDNAPVVPPGVN